MPTVAVYSTHRHPRLRYVLRELGRDLGFRFRLYTEGDEWAGAEAAAFIAYGSPPVRRGALVLPDHTFLSGRTPVAADLDTRWVDGQPLFFNTPNGADRLAMMFFALSRFEEYEPFTPDAHGRFPATASHAHRNGYLHLPVVRQQGRWIAEQLQRHFPELPPAKRLESYLQPTYDIDLLWAYRHRGWKGLASGLRDLATGEAARARERWASSEEEDPYLTLDFLLGLNSSVKPYVFWLLADNQRRQDVNPYPIPEEQRNLMRRYAESATHGLHPGYTSVEEPTRLNQERARFTNIFGRNPAHSRQHFLRLRFPATYRALRQVGITHDHTMGYADAVGWRAGTNLSFRWYDLEREEMTGLTIHPFGAMDVTLKNYLGLDAEEARNTITQLRKDVLPYGGPVTLLWHNSSFAEAYGWAGWRKMYAGLFEDE